MNKTELVAAMAEKSGLSKKDADAALKAFTETVIDELKVKGTVQIVGFGTFSAQEQKARERKNPKTGEVKLHPAYYAPKMKFGKAVKDAVKN